MNWLIIFGLVLILFVFYIFRIRPMMQKKNVGFNLAVSIKNTYIKETRKAIAKYGITKEDLFDDKIKVIESETIESE